MTRRISILLLLVLAGCSGLAQRGADRTVAPPAGAVAGLPFPDSHHASFVSGGRSVNGADYETTLPNLRVSVAGTSLQFSANATVGDTSDLSYAMYALDLTGYSDVSLLGLQWQGGAPGNSVYIGLANWSTKRWDWMAVPSTQETDIGPYTDYVNPNDNRMVICVLSTRFLTDTLDLVYFGTPGVQAPENLAASDSTYVDHIALTWDPPSSGPAPDGYSIWRSDTQGGPYAQIDTSLTANYDDSTATLDTTYWYRVKSTKAQQSDSAFSNEDDGMASAGGAGWVITVAATVAQLQDPNTISLADVNGNPAISYNRNASGYGIHYIRAQDSAGSTWNGLQDISGVGQDASLNFAGGFPGIAYSDGTPSNNIYYFRGTDASGTTWGSPITVLDLPGPNILTRPDLELIGGFPSVAFMNFDVIGSGGTELCFMRAVLANGDLWPATRVVVRTGEKDWNPQLIELAGGNPAIVYTETDLQGTENSKIMYSRATDATGGSWQPAKDIYDLPDKDTIAPVQLIVANGVPAVFFSDDGSAGTKSLWYKRANDALGNVWPNGATTIATGPIDFYDGATTINGKPAAAYVGAGGTVLYYIQAVDDSGNSWLPAAVVENNPVGLATATMRALGSPQHACIAYRQNKLDPAAGEIKFARK